MLKDKILIFAMVFILFLSVGIVSASDLVDSSLDSDMVSIDENSLVDGLIDENSLEVNSFDDNSNILSSDENSQSEIKSFDLSNDYNGNEISANLVKTAKITDNGSKSPKVKTKITSNNVKAYYKEKSYLKIYLKDSNNKALKNKSVKISLNNKIYCKSTDNLGKVALKLNLKPNKYNVKISFDGDSKYKASSTRAMIKIKKAPLSIKRRNTKSYYDSSTFFKAKIINKITKNPVKGVKVLFKVFFSKKKYKKYYSFTNEKGIATLNKRLKTGLYDVYTFIEESKKYYSYKNSKSKASLNVMDTKEMGCSSIFVYQSENESAIAFRRDSTYRADLHVVSQKWHGRTAIKQYKLTGTYFFHAIATSDGWLIGNGGWDNPTVNKNIEKLAGKIVSSNKFKKSLLKSILSQEKNLNTGHLAIVAPDGRYAVVWRSGYIKGKLEKGEYLVVPNLRSLFRHGKFKKYSKKVNTAALKIAATDIFGINRRNIMTYHYKRSTKDYKTSATLSIYGANDKGNLLGRYTAGLIDNVILKKKFISKFKLFGTPKQKLLGTHKFGNIDKLFKKQTNITVNEYNANLNQSKYFKFSLKDNKTKKPLKNVKVNLRIYTGKKYIDYIVKTNEKGIAKFNSKVLEKGVHKVLIKTANNKYIISGKTKISIIVPTLNGTLQNSTEDSSNII